MGDRTRPRGVVVVVEHVEFIVKFAESLVAKSPRRGARKLFWKSVARPIKPELKRTGLQVIRCFISSEDGGSW